MWKKNVEESTSHPFKTKRSSLVCIQHKTEGDCNAIVGVAEDDLWKGCVTAASIRPLTS